MISSCVVISLLFFSSTDGYIVQPGPLVQATRGEVWPKPQKQEKSEKYLVIRPQSFKFKTQNMECRDFLESAFNRYWNIIAATASLPKRGRYEEFRQNNRNNSKFSPVAFKLTNLVRYLEVLNVEITSENCTDDALPDFEMDETYSLLVTEEDNLLSANAIWGVLRGLETFSQLIYLDDNLLQINVTKIQDYPRFSHRGLLLDTARHFIPVYAILQTLDAMAYNKFNVFHWHIVDDHSFPYKSDKYPELSDQGAFHPISKVYEQYDIKKVIEYARERGIRVVPEFDTPGHTRSWGVSHPELLVGFYDSNGPTGDLGPMNPIKNFTYEFVANLFKEVFEVFPDDYFHIGGDEVEFDCWSSNPEINAYMQHHNITKYEEIESQFIQKVVDILHNISAKPLVWEEVFVNGVELPKSTIVHVWREEQNETLDKVTSAGYLGLLSSCWYLDHLDTGGDWQKFYQCDPFNFVNSTEQKARIIGGEACMWSESVNEHNLTPRLWPRASATAEKLWSAESVTDIEDAKKRLEEHTCRMNRRGIGAQPPNGPGVCL